MRILVFSDSHGHVGPMLDAVDAHHPDAVFHLGDVVRDGDTVRFAYPDLPFYQVEGNCDWLDTGYPAENVARLDGKTILYLHGHTRRAKQGTDEVVRQALAIGARIALFGHTHRPLYRERDGLLLVNPGAVADGCAALLTWQPGQPPAAQPITL